MDFSAQSANALSIAVELARAARAEIILLHVLDVPYLTPKDNPLLEAWLNGKQAATVSDQKNTYLAEIASIAQNKMQQLRKMCGKIPVQEKIWIAQVAKYIAIFIADQRIDLVVMGARGSTENEDLLIGSNTEKVIRTATCPVLTVKQPIDRAHFRHICFASDFMEISEKLIDFLLVLQGLFGAKLHLVKIITPANFELSNITLDHLRQFATSHQLENYTVNYFNHLSEHEGIIAFGQEIGADLLALGTHGSTGLIHLLMGSVASDVANHADLPVLTCNQYLA